MPLIASPAAAAREDAASRVRLHETNRVGVWGHQGSAIWLISYGGTSTPFGDCTFRSLTRPVAPVASVVPGTVAEMPLPVPLRQTPPALRPHKVPVTEPLPLPHSGQGAGGSPALPLTAPLPACPCGQALRAPLPRSRRGQDSGLRDPQ